MLLNDKLKKAVVEDLKEVNITILDWYSRKHGETLNFLYNKEIIDDKLIENALQEAVIKQARKDYNNMMARKGREYVLHADHIGSPECLAYALGTTEFSQKEINKIHFDHGDTAESFPKECGRENLLSVLREELLNPKPLPEFSGEGHYDEHPTCSCGH